MRAATMRMQWHSHKEWQNASTQTCLKCKCDVSRTHLTGHVREWEGRVPHGMEKLRDATVHATVW